MIVQVLHKPGGYGVKTVDKSPLVLASGSWIINKGHIDGRPTDLVGATLRVFESSNHECLCGGTIIKVFEQDIHNSGTLGRWTFHFRSEGGNRGQKWIGRKSSGDPVSVVDDDK